VTFLVIQKLDCCRYTYAMEAYTTITIVHFNDVYNIESGTQEPVGGAARFKTAVGRLSDRDPLVLFSGDALNPALMSSVTNGRQMVPVLNALGVHCAVYGNHDFDHGVDNLVKVCDLCMAVKFIMYLFFASV